MGGLGRAAVEDGRESQKGQRARPTEACGWAARLDHGRGWDEATFNGSRRRSAELCRACPLAGQNAGASLGLANQQARHLYDRDLIAGPWLALLR